MTSETIHIQIAGSVQYPFEIARLEQAVHETLAYTHTSPEVEMTLVVSDDAQLLQLNHDFLGIDAPTDVLAFPADFTDPDSQQPYLGDVVLSLPRALEQAPTNHNNPEAELLLLVVHGTLHLLGYDHATPEEQASMWTAQAEILRKIELKD